MYIKSNKNKKNKKRTISKTNKCKYCNRKTDSVDPNVLCPKCREIFGHTFYSEL